MKHCTCIYINLTLCYFKVRQARMTLAAGRLDTVLLCVRQVRRDALSHEFVQFFYADLEHPRRVTHVVDGVGASGGGGGGAGGGSRWRVSELFYDTRGKLFAMRRESELFYVALDPTDSPIVVLNGVGSVVKQVRRLELHCLYCTDTKINIYI